MAMQLRSSAFEHGKPIPKKYTGDGEDVSPPLAWSGAPPTTRAFALICDDPDAPTDEPWVHWLIYDIAPDVDHLPEAVAPTARPKTPAGALQGRNSWTRGNTIGYRGPAPPPGHGVHHYHFRLFALDAPLRPAHSVDRRSLTEAMHGHVLEQAELIGTYRR